MDYLIRRVRVLQVMALDERDRWRVYCGEAERWFAEFPDVVDALAHLKAKATGAGGTDIMRTRDAMRSRRDKTTIQLTPAEIQSKHDRVRWAEGLIRQLPDTHDGRNSWLLNHARDDGLDKKRKPSVMTAQAAAAREEEFRVQYQHLGAEVAGDD